MAERRAAWTRDLPQSPAELWAYVVGLDGDSRAALLAFCVAQSLNGVRSFERRAGAWAHADHLAAHLKLDMSRTWTATAASYFGRVTKSKIAEAVTEGVSAQAAEGLAGMKKDAMAEAAERLLDGKGWLPELLRTPGASPMGDESGAAFEENGVVTSGEGPVAEAPEDGAEALVGEGETGEGPERATGTLVPAD
jgi:ParB family chromosome partitioning protein